MSRKKGTSMEEKKRLLLAAFQERRDVFNAKEVGKLAEKKGIRGPVALDVLKALTDDNLVDNEKVGGCNYYWSFPNKEAKMKQVQLDDMKRKLDREKKKLKQLLEKVKNRMDHEPDPEKRVKAEQELTLLESKRDELMKEMDKYKDCDPHQLEKMKEDVEVARDAVERWTDAVFSIKKYAKDKFGMQEENIVQGLGIPKNFDYLDN